MFVGEFDFRCDELASWGSLMDGVDLRGPRECLGPLRGVKLGDWPDGGTERLRSWAAEAAAAEIAAATAINAVRLLSTTDAVLLSRDKCDKA